ncbi:hypothetical protein AB1E19_015907 [Capra hircus]
MVLSPVLPHGCVPSVLGRQVLGRTKGWPWVLGKQGEAWSHASVWLQDRHSLPEPEAAFENQISQWQDPLGRAGARLAEVLEELGLRRLPGSGMMLPDLSDLWAHLESTSRLLSAHGCPGEPQGQGAEIVACEMMGTLMHSRQYLKDATPLAAPKNEATLPERWPEAGLQEARLFSRRMHRLLRCPGNC